MLMDMKLCIEVMCMLVYYVVVNIDCVYVGDVVVQVCVDLLILVVKGWSMEQGVELILIGVQVFGGVGFIEEIGVCQYYCDFCIMIIYEGMIGIQVNDLIGCKLVCEKVLGVVMQVLIGEMNVMVVELQVDDCLKGIVVNLKNGINLLFIVVDWFLVNYDSKLQVVVVGVVFFFKLIGIVVGGWLMVKLVVIVVKYIVVGMIDDFYIVKFVIVIYFVVYQLLFVVVYFVEIIGGSDVVFVLFENFF